MEQLTEAKFRSQSEVIGRYYDFDIIRIIFLFYYNTYGEYLASCFFNSPGGS